MRASMTAKEKHFALLGDPVEHSLSPLLHTLISEAAGLACHYEARRVAADDLAETWPQIICELDGFNITVPHKQAALALSASATDEAERLGAANTYFRGRAYNTDFLALREVGPKLRGRHILLIGYGGVARALAARALEDGCASLTVTGRNKEKAAAFLQDLLDGAWEKKEQGRSARVMDEAALAAALRDDGLNCDVLLQGSSQGMWPKSAVLPLEVKTLDLLFKKQMPEVFDVIYNPGATRLLLMAENAGLSAENGLRMLLWQALLAQRIWRPDADFSPVWAQEAAILARLRAELLRRYPQRILITGFMGAGKSSVAQRLARDLGYAEAACDLDNLIEADAGMRIADIFAAEGEAGFRARELRLLRGLLRRDRQAASGPLLVALGGGTLLQPGVPELARQAGALIVHLDAKLGSILERLHQSSGRPLIDQRERELFVAKTTALYERRRPLYLALADLSVAADEDQETVAREICRALGWPSPASAVRSPDVGDRM